MESGSTGQTRSGNPPPACGGVCARVRRPRPGAQLHGKAQSAAPASRRMRLSVTSPPGRRGAQPPASLRGTMESGPTGQMRSSNPRQAAGGLRRGPAGLGRRARPHGKAQSGQRASLKARPELGRDTTNQAGTPSGCQLWAKEMPGLRVRCTCSSCHSTKAQLVSL